MIFRTHAIGSDYGRKSLSFGCFSCQKLWHRKIIQNSCWSMLFTYSLGSRIGFCKFLILLATIVNSIVIGVSFDNVAGAGGINFVQDVNIFWFDIF